MILYNQKIYKKFKKLGNFIVLVQSHFCRFYFPNRCGMHQPLQPTDPLTSCRITSVCILFRVNSRTSIDTSFSTSSTAF